MKPVTIAITAAVLGVGTATIVAVSRAPAERDSKLAKKVGFSSAQSYRNGLDLVEKSSKSKHLSDLEGFKHLAQQEGDSGQLMALAVMLPLRDAEEQRRCLDLAEAALTNPVNKVMAIRVLSTYKNTNPSVVESFLTRHPDFKALLVAKQE